MMMVGLLLIFAQAQAAYTNENDDAWIKAPRSGSITTTERVDVALALRPGPATTRRIAGHEMAERKKNTAPR